MKRLVFSALLLAGISTNANANLITNGDFENGLTGWTSNDVTIINSGVAGYDHFAFLNDNNSLVPPSIPSGDDGNNRARLVQSFYIDPSIENILIEFDYIFIEEDQSRRRTDSFLSQLFTLDGFTTRPNGRVRPVYEKETLVRETQSTGIIHYQGVFDVSNIFDLDPNAFLRFTLNENPNNMYTDSVAGLDNISVTAAAVPEPSTLALMGLSLIGLGLIRRRQTR